VTRVLRLLPSLPVLRLPTLRLRLVLPVLRLTRLLVRRRLLRQSIRRPPRLPTGLCTRLPSTVLWT